MFYLLLRFDHHRRPSSGTECSVVTARYVSRSLADLLAPIVGKPTLNITNSKHLASEVAGVMVEQDEMFLSHDVVSLIYRRENWRM